LNQLNGCSVDVNQCIQLILVPIKGPYPVRAKWLLYIPLGLTLKSSVCLHIVSVWFAQITEQKSNFVFYKTD